MAQILPDPEITPLLYSYTNVIRLYGDINNRNN